MGDTFRLEGFKREREISFEEPLPGLAIKSIYGAGTWLCVYILRLPSLDPIATVVSDSFAPTAGISTLH